MFTYVKSIPEKTTVTHDEFGRPHSTTFPAQSITVAPTLQKLHAYLWSDFGPLTVSWKHGWLCPFHEDAGHKRITCSGGLRSSWFCTGIKLTESHTSHLPNSFRDFLLDRVQCPNWNYRLGDFYWQIPTERLLKLPDDEDFAFIYVLDKIYRESGWVDWQAASIDPHLPLPPIIHGHFCTYQH